MENFDLLALYGDLARRLGGAVVRRISPAPDPEPEGVHFDLEGRERLQLVFSPGPLFPCLLLLPRPGKPPGAEGAKADPRPVTGDGRPAASPSPFVMLLRKYLQGAVITAVEKPPLERIVLLAARNTLPGGLPLAATLVAELTGRSANLVLLDGEGKVLGSCRRPSGERLLPGAPYAPPARGREAPAIDPFQTGPAGAARPELEALVREELEQPAAAEERAASVRRLSRRLAGFGPRHAAELAARLRGAAGAEGVAGALRAWDGWLEELQGLRREGEQPGFLYRPRDPRAAGEPLLSAVRLAASLPPDHWLEKRVPSLVEAAARLRRELLDRGLLEGRRRPLLRDLRKAREKSLRLRARLETEEREFGRAEELRRDGELLTAALQSFGSRRSRRGSASIRVPDFYSPAGEEAEIRLDPKLTLVQNSQSFFRRYRRALRGREAVQGRLERVRLEGDYFEELLSAAELATTPGELEEVSADAQIAGILRRPRPEGRRAPAPAAPAGGPRRFRSGDGLTILVGRSSRGNDRLTFRTASPDDFWLHAAGLPGSHVVVRNPQRLPELPPRTLEEAAGLAAWFSRGRGSAKLEVHLTRCREVRKPRGAPPGLVTLRSSRAVVARPALLEEREGGVPD